MITSVRRRYWLWKTFFGIGGAIFGFLSVEVSPIFIAPLIVVLIIAALGLMSLQCKKCGASFLYRDENVFGIRTRALWSTLPKKCPACGIEI